VTSPVANHGGGLVSLGGIENDQYHAPGTPMRTASKDTSRPIPENNAIGTSGLVFDFWDEVVDTEIGGEIRAAFGISGSPMHLVQKTLPS
jgi:hypothetical protein